MHCLNAASCRMLPLGLLLFAAGLCFPPDSQPAAAAEEPRVLRAGAYAADITPTYFPVSTTPHRDHQVLEVHDRLYARCVVLDDGQTRIAIVICDNNMIPREFLDAAKAKAAAATGIPSENILVAATHTHSAVTVAGMFQSKRETKYIPFLIEQIARGIEQAVAHLEPARVGWAVGRNSEQVFNRRWFMKAGFELNDPLGLGTDRVRMNPPPGDPALDRPAGPTDPEVCLLSIQARSGRPIALLANYALHYVGNEPYGTLSADYFGEFARCITRRIGAENVEPPFVGIMSNGTSGDANNINVREPGPPREPFEQIQIVAAAVADSAFEAYQRIEYQESVPLLMREREIELGVRLPTETEVAQARKRLENAGPELPLLSELEYSRETILLAEYPARVTVKLQAIRIGGLGIVSSPCETFVETGLAIKQASPLQPTFVIELANGYNGYLPTPEQHRLGGYETWRARSSYLEIDAATKIQSTLLSLLREVASGSEFVVAGEPPGKTSSALAPSLAGEARPDEPLRGDFSLDAAVASLDDAALTWQRDKKCFACHSNYAFLETRPLVSWKTPIHDELRAKLEELAANPRQVSFRVMEGVMAACVLAQNDALTTGKLHPVTRQALDYMWTLQRDDGGFHWEKSSQPPSEIDDHFGATMAVIGVGVAPDGYATTPTARAGLDRIRQYLVHNPPVNLHQRSMLLLGSLHVDGIMTAPERDGVVDSLFAVQKRDGGWGIVSLGNWKRHDAKEDDQECSDGYGTGLAICVLRQAGVPADDSRIQHGIAWLKANQRASGRWFTRSQWEDSRHYLSRQGTAWAIRALVTCGEQ
ncbi:MAG: hypothetical protein ACYC6N_05325 [Pirellulaceae bacterium]